MGPYPIEKRKEWFELAAVISIAVLPDLYYAAKYIIYPEMNQVPGNMYTFLIFRSIWVTIPIVYIVNNSERNLKDYGLSKIESLKDVFIGLFIFVILMIFVLLVFPVISYYVEMSGFQNNTKFEIDLSSIPNLQQV